MVEVQSFFREMVASANRPPNAWLHEAQGELLVLDVGRVEGELHLYLHEQPQHDVAASLEIIGVITNKAAKKYIGLKFTFPFN